MAWELAASIQLAYEWRHATRRIFEEADIVLSPTTKITAPRIDEGESISTTWQLTYLTYPWSLAHVPAMSLPCGFSREGCPIGIQVAAGPGKEALLLKLARMYQEVTDWHRRRPRCQRAPNLNPSHPPPHSP
jgi:aspartyl-tRNA(Asn)/glutamyl-tRNA(Gln) amidotransferase subunit A